MPDIGSSPLQLWSACLDFSGAHEDRCAGFTLLPGLDKENFGEGS